MKIAIVTIALGLLILVTPTKVLAKLVDCEEQYGGGVICGETTEPVVHEPIETAMGDINLYVLAGGALAVAFVFFKLSKYSRREYVLGK